MFLVKQWKNKPDTSTPISGAALTDLEQRLAAYAETMHPIGIPTPWPTGTPPSGWTIYDGKAISRAGNPVLFSMFGTTFGAGDGSTTFGIPDLRGKMLIGAGGPPGYGLWATGGEINHTLSIPEIPVHNHGSGGGSASGYQSANHTHGGTTAGDYPDHAHGFNDWGGYGRFDFQAGSGGWVAAQGWGQPGVYTGGGTGGANARHQHDFATGYVSADHTHALTPQGSSNSHNNMPPYFALYWMTRLG